MPFRLRDAARLDLATIWLASAERWGVDQADDYIRSIEDRIRRLCDFPNSCPSYAAVGAQFRKAASGEHLIFYIVASDDLIDVVRILHNRTDIEARLG